MLLHFVALRTIFIFSSTAFALLFVMMALNIITVDDVISILHLEGNEASAFRTVIYRIQEVTGNLIQIISQLLNKLFGWAGVDVDLNKIKIDVHNQPSIGGGNPAAVVDPVVAPSAAPASSQVVIHPPLNSIEK